MTDNCQHRRIDNDTRCCTACGEAMVAVSYDAETVRSAPNLAACQNPACLQAMNDGTYDGDDPPAGCTNPNGVYIEDVSRAREIVMGYRVSYQCRRCENGGMIITPDRMELDCGQWHEGDYVRSERSGE